MISFDAVDTYRDVLVALESSGARYVVVGGFAVVVHGYVRPVADLDVAIDRHPANAAVVLQALAHVGFFPTIPLPPLSLTILRTFDASGRGVDIIARPYVAFEELWSASSLTAVGRGWARIASLEHVLSAKRQSGRREDLADIQGLLGISRRDS